MKTINITKGKKVLIDDEDYERLIKFKWHTVKGQNTDYAYTDNRILIDGIKREGEQIAMHRFILGLTKKDKLIDHIDRNGLNNQKNNLRLVTNQENCFNVPPKHKNKTSKYKGVYKTENGKFEAQIKINYRSNSLGRYTSEEMAAKIYDAAARFYAGESAFCNFDEEFIPRMSVKDIKEKKYVRLLNNNTINN